MKKVDRLFVGPELFEKRPVVRRGVGDGNQFGPHLADMSDLRVAPSPCRLPAQNRAFSAFRVLETDRPAGRPACFFVPVGANPVERDGARLRRFPPRGSMASCSLSFRRLPVVQARGSTTGSCLPTLRRVWPLPAACNGPGPGERRPGSQPIVDRRERFLARPEDRTEQRRSSASAQPEPCRPTGPPLSSRRTCTTRHSAAPPPPTSKSANATFPFGPFLDEGCERPERPGGRGPLLDDGRKSPHRPGGHRGELREGQTVTATLAWVVGSSQHSAVRQEHSFLPRAKPGTAFCHEIVRPRSVSART